MATEPSDDKAESTADNHISSDEGEVITIEAELPSGDDEIEALIEPAGSPEEEAQDTAEEKEEMEEGSAAPEDFRLEPEQKDPPKKEDKKPHGPRKVIAIASGKGGVGKSLLAAGIGVYLAQLGKRVVLLDANLGSGNLHHLLGVENPRLSLHDFLSKKVKQLEEVVASTPFKGLGLISGHDNAPGTTNPQQAQKTRLMHQIRTLNVDYVIIDLGAGSDFNTMDLFLSADLHLVMVVPEPTSIESAFRLIKSAFTRKLRSYKGFTQLVSDLQPSAYCGIPTPNQLYQVARERDPKLGQTIHKAMTEFRPRLVVNMTRTRDDLELGPAIRRVARRHLALPFDYLGYMENEDVVWVTVRRRRSLLVEYPEAKVAKDIERITRRILSLETKENPECLEVPPSLDEQDNYNILGLHPGATVEEIRRAQRRVRRTYNQDSLAIHGIAPPVEVNKMLNRIEEAHTTLVDPEKRHHYDKRLFPSGVTPDSVTEERFIQESFFPARQDTTPVSERPAMPSIEEHTIFTGALLGQIREAHGIDLQEIAHRTKISMTYLRAIESEDYLVEPAAVYLKGFVKTVSQELKLDPEQVSRTYMERYAAAKDQKKKKKK